MDTNKQVNRFAALYTLFEYAVSQNLKYPKIRLQHPTQAAETVIVKLAGAKSKYNGQLMVTNDAGYGSSNNRYYGRIDNSGAIYSGRDLTPAIEALLEEFAADPVGVAQRYGKLTGNCMFCGKKLDDPISVAVGYGPVCAKKWHLPHNAGVQARKSRREEATHTQEPCALPVGSWGTQNFLHEGVDLAAEVAADNAQAELDAFLRGDDDPLK